MFLKHFDPYRGKYAVMSKSCYSTSSWMWTPNTGRSRVVVLIFSLNVTGTIRYCLGRNVCRRYLV